MMSTWTTGVNLSDLAASHLQQPGVTAFSFLSSNNSESYNSASTRDVEAGKDKSVENSVEIHFDEFDEFFEEVDFDADFSSLNDTTGFATSTLLEAKPSLFGCVICGASATGKKITVDMLSDQGIFAYEAQSCLNEMPSQTKTPQRTLFHKPKPVTVVHFDFSTPSPDDIIIAKQKAAL